MAEEDRKPPPPQQQQQQRSPFTVDRVISKRQASSVLLVTSRQTLQKGIVKLSVRKAKYTGENPEREVANNQMVKKLGAHAHIVNMIGFEVSRAEVALVTEYCPGGDVFGLLEAGKPLETKRALEYIRQVAVALQWLHQHHIAHLDVSPENMLLSESQDVVKLGDFGAALVLEGKKGSQVVSLGCHLGKEGYMAPEVAFLEAVDCFKADVWSLGISLFVLLTGFQPYSSPLNDPRFKYLWTRGIRWMVKEWKIQAQVPPRIQDLLAKMLVPQAERITIQEVLAHRCFVQKSVLSISCVK